MSVAHRIIRTIDMVTPKRQRFKAGRERKKNMTIALEIKKTDVYLPPLSKKEGEKERKSHSAIAQW